MLKEIKTKDGSLTFHNERYQEYYHSLTGAEEEAVKKYAEPCRISELAKKGRLKLLDVCFGLGYNTAAAIDAAKRSNTDCEIEVTGLENDEEILEKIGDVESAFDCYGIIKDIPKNLKDKNNKIVIDDRNRKIKMTLFVDDARDSIKLLAPAEFDAVFLDPFSLTKCPELWTDGFFKDIRRVMKKEAILATYSCARTVRDNLKKAGFKVKDGPTIGRRGPATIALLQSDD